LKNGIWEAVMTLAPGKYQYKFVVDGISWIADPTNPAKSDDQRGGFNSCFTINELSQIELRVQEQKKSVEITNPTDEYSAGPTVYLNMIWHQHQPLYLNPELDRLEGPWVRTHATKDYHDMAAMLEKYPSVHTTINLTTSLLHQLQYYYVERLMPYVGRRIQRIDTRRFFSKWRGKTDPWIDLALTPSSQFGETEKSLMKGNGWNCFSVSDVMMNRWPEYQALRDKPLEQFTIDDFTQAKGFFYFAQFDPDFLSGEVVLPTKEKINLSELVSITGDASNPVYRLKKPLTEDDCNHLVACAALVMEAVIPMHRQLQYDVAKQTGQIEIITTPYYHPILPLLIDSDIAKRCQPGDKLPERFTAPDDANAQVLLATNAYHSWFGSDPAGMWPGEGSVAPEILPMLAKHGIRWTASDRQVLSRSIPANQPLPQMYVSGMNGSDVALVFRDTDLSDRLGFRYQSMDPEAAAEDFIQGVLSYAKQGEVPYVSVILDGENAWEHYSRDNDAKRTLHAIYRKLTKLYQMGRIVTVTPSEYLSGNLSRGVTPHQMRTLPRLTTLHSGSWIYGTYDTWIGEAEENAAWNLLKQVRNDLVASGISAPDLSKPIPMKNTKEYYQYQAWMTMYAAEGSDWFWWYGTDQNAPGGGDAMFDQAYRTLLQNVYRYMKLAGAKVEEKQFPSLLQETGNVGGGAMQRGSK
ncbi:MAG: hypothetical protein OEM52_08575, partial [bacterium]|nr:hypothetical protein [bacterium]